MNESVTTRGGGQLIQIKVTSGTNVIAEAELNKTAVGNGNADYEGALVEAGATSGGMRRRTFEVHAVDRSRGTWYTVLQILLEATRGNLTSSEFRALMRGPRLCRNRKHPAVGGRCEACRRDQAALIQRRRLDAKVAREKTRRQKRIDNLIAHLAIARRDLETLDRGVLPAPRRQNTSTARSEAQYQARIANAAKARAAKVAKQGSAG